MQFIASSHANLATNSETAKSLSGNRGIVWNVALPARLTSFVTYKFDSTANYRHNDFKNWGKLYFFQHPYPYYSYALTGRSYLCGDGKANEA